MGIRLGQRSSPPVRVHREKIDENMVALIASAEAFHHGGYYRSGAFVLIEMKDWLRAARYTRQEIGEACLRKHIEAVNYGELEYVCRAVDVQTV